MQTDRRSLPPRGLSTVFSIGTPQRDAGASKHRRPRLAFSIWTLTPLLLRVAAARRFEYGRGRFLFNRERPRHQHRQQNRRQEHLLTIATSLAINSGDAASRINPS